MTMIPQIITRSQAAAIPPKDASSANVISTASGTCIKSIIFEVIFRQSSQICGLANNRNAKMKVRTKRSFGSSPSKPRPVSMVFAAWNTRFPSRMAQPMVRTICWILLRTGICSRR